MLGCLPEIAKGLGFAFAEHDGTRFAIGREGVFEGCGLPAPWWKDVDELVDTVVNYRFRRPPGPSGRRPATLEPDEWTRLHRALGAVLRISVSEGWVPPRHGWLTGVRDDPSPFCPRCGTGCGVSGPAVGPPDGARPANHPQRN